MRNLVHENPSQLAHPKSPPTIYIFNITQLTTALWGQLGGTEFNVGPTDPS